MTTSGVIREKTGWTVDASTFAARLALVRMRMGWNVKEAARECGQAAATWRLWEMDGITPRNHVQVAKQISDRTGCDYLWLLLGPDRGEGGEPGMMAPNKRLDALAARVISRRATTGPHPDGRPTASRPPTMPPVHPTRRRPVAVHPASRAERVTV